MDIDLLSRIKALCQQRGTTIAKVEAAVGFNKTIYNWGKNSPSIDKVAKVADYFHLTIDELIGRDVASTLTDDEQCVLDLLDRLNDDGRDAAIAMLAGLAAQPIYKKSALAEALEA